MRRKCKECLKSFIYNFLLFKLVNCTEPCSDYTDLNDATRFVSYDLPFGNIPGCDRLDITEGWYRFEGDRNIPTSAPDPGKCGTDAPIWIDGILPTDDGDLRTLTACKVGFVNQCEESWDIDVKKCGLFNIFRLTPILSCEGRYCMDVAQLCPEGTSSDSGFRPCTAEVNITISGRVLVSPYIPTYDPYSKDRMLMFRCYFWPSDTSTDYSNLLYDVRWDIEDEEFVKKSNLNYSQILTDGVLKSSEWKDRGRQIGFYVKCSIRARIDENYPPSPYLEGDPVFAGIQILPQALTITSGQSAHVWLRPTVPIACVFNSSYPCKLRIEMFDFTEQFPPGSQMYCNESITEFMKPSLCGLEIDGWKRWDWQRMNVSVPATTNPNQEYTAVLKLRSSGLSYDKLWTDYHLYPITINVVNSNLTSQKRYWFYAWCFSLTDPIILTFDNRMYGFNDEGEFVMFRHKTKPIEVNTIQRKFDVSDSWTENCAVAIRAASDVFIIYGCSRPTKWIIRRPNCKAGAEYLKIYHRWNSYEVHLPSGTIVYVWKSLNRRLNIIIKLSQSDRKDVEGICGNRNEDPDDDFMDRNGTIFDNPTLFARSWRVPVEESLFVAKRREERLSNTYMYCTCLGETRGQLSPDVDCSWQENLPVCPPINWDFQPCKIRGKRSVDEDDDVTIDVPLDIVSHKEHPEANTNWKNGWNEESAENACLSSFKQSPVYDECTTLESLNISADLSTCITNIKISGTTDFVEDSLDSVISKCSLTLRLNTSLHDAVDENGTNIFDKIFNNMCPNDCKNKGVKTGKCESGLCTCFDGYTGDDCSININSPPTVSGLSNEYICDASVRSCGSFSIYGDGFYSSGNLKCRYRIGRITDASIIPEGSYSTKDAFFKNNGEVQCDISATSSARKRSASASSSTTTVYLVSVSTNGNDFSAEVPVVIYDSNCLECTVINSMVLCQTKSDVCIVGDTCQPKNSTACLTTDNGNKRTESSDSDSKLWIIGVVIAILAVIILIMLLLKLKNNKCMAVFPFCQPIPKSHYKGATHSENFDTLSEMTMGSKVSLQNVPPVSTKTVFFREKSKTQED